MLLLLFTMCSFHRIFRLCVPPVDGDLWVGGGWEMPPMGKWRSSARGPLMDAILSGFLKHRKLQWLTAPRPLCACWWTSCGCFFCAKVPGVWMERHLQDPGGKKLQSDELKERLWTLFCCFWYFPSAKISIYYESVFWLLHLERSAPCPDFSAKPAAVQFCTPGSLHYVLTFLFAFIWDFIVFISGILLL